MKKCRNCKHERLFSYCGRQAKEERNPFTGVRTTDDLVKREKTNANGLCEYYKRKWYKLGIEK